MFDHHLERGSIFLFYSQVPLLSVGSFVLSSIVLTLIGYSDREWILGGNYSTERGCSDSPSSLTVFSSKDSIND